MTLEEFATDLLNADCPKEIDVATNEHIFVFELHCVEVTVRATHTRTGWVINKITKR